MVFDLSEFKDEFTVLAKKYKLPSFEKLNDDFEIDKIDRETFNSLKLVRKVMMEKIVNSVSFLELFINPANAPRMYYSFIRSMGAEDKKTIETLYGSLSKLSISSLELEIDVSEKKEAEIIQEIYNTWQGLKPGFRELLKKMRTPILNGDNGSKKDKSYFG